MRDGVGVCRLKRFIRVIGRTRVGSRSGWKRMERWFTRISRTVGSKYRAWCCSGVDSMCLFLRTGTQLYNLVASQLQRLNPSLVYTKPARQPSSSGSKSATNLSAVTTTKSNSKKPAKSSNSTATNTSRPTPSKPTKLGPRPPQPPHPLPSMEDRYPLNSPLLALGVAVEAVKRDVEQENENKKKGIGAGLVEGGEGKAQPKAPKMKKIMVRKR